MSESNISLTKSKTNIKIKLNKTTTNNKNDEIFQINETELYNAQSSSKKKNFDNQKKIEIEFGVQNNKNISGPLKEENDSEKQLLYYFKDKKIYIEIYNGILNASQTFFNLLLKYKIIPYKKLSKKIDYIIFKDGHLKTKKYAVLNNIKMVNPLWIDDKINKHIFKDDREYEIENNFGDIVIREKYEKNKNDENTNKEKENIENKNYELELEAEYDTEYANLIDEVREIRKNNYSKIENPIINDSENQKNIDEIEESESHSKNDKNKNIEIKRKKRKRKSSDNNLENRLTLNNDKNSEKKIINDYNRLSKNNSKNQKKEIIPKKKNKTINEIEKKSKKNNDKKKSKDENSNYILDFDQKTDKKIVLKKQNDIISNSMKVKINIITYKLELEEIQCLRSLNYFEYKGNLNNNNENDDKIYNNANIIILERKKDIYNWKLYEFLLDRKIIVDFTSFLLEFINSDKSYNNDSEKLIEKINEMSLNNEFYFFNKKKRMQKRTMIQSLNIINNIILKNKKEKNYQQQNDIGNKFYFMINQDINDDEKRIFQKLLKNFLKGKLINTNRPKNLTRRVSSQINLKIQKKSKKTKKKNFETQKENIFKMYNNNSKEKEKEKNIYIIKKKNEIMDNKNALNKENIPESENKFKKIEDIYLISKDKVNSIKILNKTKYYKGIISYKYIYDSFINGQLLDLNKKEIFEKYKLE